MKTADIPVTCLLDTKDKLGEGCFWDADTQTLWWLDILMPSAIHRYHVASGAHRKWCFSEKVTAMAKRKNGTVLVGSHTGVNVFDPVTGTLTPWCKIDPETPGNRGNDGACDARGRFWFGTMMNNIGSRGEDLPITASTGKLFRIDATGGVEVMETGIGVSNGPCWSPDNRTFYFTDSMAQVIFAYDFDLDSGTLSNRRVLNDTKDHGYPDGATVDADGCIWSARWGRARSAADRPQGPHRPGGADPRAAGDECVFRRCAARHALRHHITAEPGRGRACRPAAAGRAVLLRSRCHRL